jgi:heme O synthase-like polyprenyltransferase
MMPGDAGSPGFNQAATACLRHCAYLQILCVLCSTAHLGLTHPYFTIEATILNAVYAYMAYQMQAAGASGHAGRTNTAARRLFLASLLYLPVLLGFMCLHRCVAVTGADASCPYVEANRMVAEDKKKPTNTAE